MLKCICLIVNTNNCTAKHLVHQFWHGAQFRNKTHFNQNAHQTKIFRIFLGLEVRIRSNCVEIVRSLFLLASTKGKNKSFLLWHVVTAKRLA